MCVSHVISPSLVGVQIVTERMFTDAELLDLFQAEIAARPPGLDYHKCLDIVANIKKVAAAHLPLSGACRALLCCLEVVTLPPAPRS